MLCPNCEAGEMTAWGHHRAVCTWCGYTIDDQGAILIAIPRWERT